MLSKHSIYQSKIDLSGKGLKSFPTELYQFKNLKKLNLSNNSICTIPKEINRIKSLQNLDLSNNKIKNLYANIFELRKLKTLIINNNNIQKLPKQINNLINLKSLHIANNYFSILPAEIKSLIKLESINLSNNNFEEFPEELLSITSLKRIWFSNNPIQTFPLEKIIDSYPHLNSFYCYSKSIDNEEIIDGTYLRLSKIKGNVKGKFSKEKIRREILSEDKEEMNKNKTKSNKAATNQDIRKKQIFISYSHNDIRWLEEVKKHLKVLRFENKNFEIWEDTMIKPGDNWKKEISKSLESCKIAILIISTDFLASDFVRENELPPLLSAAETKGTKILSLIVGHSRYAKTESISKFQAINEPSKPLEELNRSDQAKILVDLTDEIESLIE